MTAADSPSDWERLEQGGEAGAVHGAGFAAVDNLVFDKRNNVWGTIDMSTGLLNGFTDGIPNNPTTINHTATGDVSTFIGVFGNNWLFFVPTSGPNAGEIFPFAYGPTRCELTGPTFVGNTLIISVQHPGEDCDYQLDARRRSTATSSCSTSTGHCSRRTAPCRAAVTGRAISRGCLLARRGPV